MNQVTINMEPPQEWRKSNGVLIPVTSDQYPSNTGLSIVKSKPAEHLYINDEISEFQYGF